MKKTVFLVVMGLLLGSIACFSQDGAQSTQTQSTTIAAIVNGEEISIAQLNSNSGISQIFQVLFSEVPQAFAQSLLSTPEGAAFLDRYQRDVLDQIINSRIMVQQAEAIGVSVDETELSEEVQSYLSQIMQQNQMTLEDIDAALQQQGSSLDEYEAQLEKSFKEQLMVQALQRTVVADVTIDDNQVEEYYEKHQADYTDNEGTAKPLDEVAEEIRDNLLNAAKSSRWNEWFKEAKDSCEITILF